MGPLQGVRVLEFAGLGPGPLAAMLLAELGATVLRVERPGAAGKPEELKYEFVKRSRSAVTLDVKSPAGLALANSLVERADALIEGFRPGAMERMGLGPDTCLERNPRLVYCRMTGWGQDGPLARVAGHDLNYIGLAGALDSIGRAGQPPTPPLNLVGDYCGGALYLALGLVSALLEARQSDRGQVLDVAMVDGVASVMTKFYGLSAAGLAKGQPVGPRGTNLADSGAPFYEVYECADGQWLAVAPLEPQFFALFLSLMKIDPAEIGPQWDCSHWPRAREILAARIRQQPIAYWRAIFDGTDACVSPVLPVSEAPNDPHLRARGTFVEVEGILQPAPAPRFSRTQLARPTPPRPIDSDRAEALRQWGIDEPCPRAQ